jgi:hypothetical protein
LPAQAQHLLPAYDIGDYPAEHSLFSSLARYSPSVEHHHDSGVLLFQLHSKRRACIDP